MRTGWLWALALVALGMPAGAATLRTPPPRRPRLIVTLVVDQFSDELYRRYRPTFTGGLRRLGAGIAFTGYQSHAATETCPGHSTILTGRHPAATGIVANSWRDRATGAHVYCVSVPGADADSRGPQNLRVDTLGDWLKRSEPAARVVSVSGKDRAAIMLGGHHADAVYWWKDGIGFGTSAYAGPAGDDVTAPASAFDAERFAGWRKAAPRLWPDVPPRCAALGGPHRFGAIDLSGTVPPEAAARAQAAGPDGGDFPAQLRASPIFDPLTLDFAGRLIERDRLGHGAGVDLLAVSLSATDLIGHRYGNGGAEMCVQMAALDRALGAFLARLDRLRVPYAVVLTADHGGSDAPERAAEHGVAARRIDPAAFVNALNAHLWQTLGLKAPPIAGDDPQQLSIVAGDDPVRRARVRDAAIAWIKAQPDVVAVFTAAEVAAAAPPAGKPVTALSLAERFHESYDPDRSGDIQVAFAEHATIGMPHKAGDAVAGHGTPWDYDRRVPILFWWPGIVPQARRDPAETVDIAPTLAAIAHVSAPPVDGHCLVTVARACPRSSNEPATTPH